MTKNGCSLLVFGVSVCGGGRKSDGSPRGVKPPPDPRAREEVLSPRRVVAPGIRLGDYLFPFPRPRPEPLGTLCGGVPADASVECVFPVVQDCLQKGSVSFVVCRKTSSSLRRRRDHCSVPSRIAPGDPVCCGPNVRPRRP